MKDRAPKWYRRSKVKIVIPDRVARRAATNYTVAANGCWISRYSRGSHGYAQIGWQDGSYRQTVTAHRAAWVYVNGQIPDGVTIDHEHCNNPPCVNPDHLRAISNHENARRTHGRSWELGTCSNGHPNSELRLETDSANSGGVRRRCQPCAKLYQTRRLWRRKNKGNDYPAHLQLGAVQERQL